MPIKLLDYSTYQNAAISIGGEHWAGYKSRWTYHNAAVQVIKNLNIVRSSDVLEAGTMGVNLVADSHTIDMPMSENNIDWVTPTYKSTVYHDLKNIPWPFADKSYKLFCALRVWHHLEDQQHACFLEAKRIANMVLLVVPRDTSNNPHANAITPEQFSEWNKKSPDELIDLGDIGVLYLFS